MECPRCGVERRPDHRFCPSCGAPLPSPARGSTPKVSEWFWSVPVGPGDPPQAALRVSCYLEEIDLESEGATVRVPRDHVRFSVWVDDHAICAVSIPNHEAERLVEFLRAWLPGTDPGTKLRNRLSASPTGQ